MSSTTGEEARASDGIISFLRSYSTLDPDHDTPDDLPYLYPRAVPNANCHPPQARTLSLWRDLEAVHAYAYRGFRARALRLRTEWFVKPLWPTYVAWWVTEGEEPTWEDAVARLDYLQDHGPWVLAHRPGHLLSAGTTNAYRTFATARRDPSCRVVCL